MVTNFVNKLTESTPSFAFDDFLLVPSATSILPAEADLTTRVTKNIEMKLPILSSAMDTVTESDLAISLARFGGLGIIHRNFRIKDQVAEVRKVKRAESIIIRNVATVSPDQSLEEVKRISLTKSFTGFPVIEGDKFIGIITNRDVRSIESNDAKVRDAMNRNVITASENIDIEEAKRIMNKNKIEKLPVLSDDKLVGLITLKDINLRQKYPEATRDAEGKLRVGAAVGVDFERAQKLFEAGADVIVIDTGHGHNVKVVEFTKELKNKLNCEVMVGNIATREAAEDLISAGADALKVGVGPGSICTTRVISGAGVPQLTAIAEVADVAKEHGISVIADGGIRNPGDVAKAIAVGADAVMLGNMLAGTDETPGEIIIRDGKKYKKYRGMGSKGAMIERYFQERAKYVPEGVEGLVPYKGKAGDIIEYVSGGLRSSMGYIGAKTIREMHEKARLLKVTGAGVRESRPHSLEAIDETVGIVKEFEED